MASPRVNLQPSTSHDTTSPRTLRLMTRTHQRKTSKNTPITDNPSKTDNKVKFAPKRAEKREPVEQTKNQHPFDAQTEIRYTRAATRDILVNTNNRKHPIPITQDEYATATIAKRQKAIQLIAPKQYS